MMERPDTLKEAIARALEVAGEKKGRLNEACTCDWIIKPLLWAAGYSVMEISAQERDSAGNKPDYIILPETGHPWILEAKAWNVNLEDSHAWQALTYAFTKNVRWVVLSNGLEWRLYDREVDGEASRRLAATARLEDQEGAARFLTAIGRQSVLDGSIEQFALKERLRAVLKEQLTDAGSEAVRALWNRLRGLPGLSKVSREDVAGVLKELIGPAFPPPPRTPPPPPPPPPTGWYSLRQLNELFRSGAGRLKPAAVRLPDGSEKDVTTWKSLAVETVRWVADNRGVPQLPFRVGNARKRCFLNREPKHPDGGEEFINKARVDSRNGTFYVETNRDRWSLVEAVLALCDATGVGDGVHVRLQPQGDSGEG